MKFNKKLLIMFLIGTAFLGSCSSSSSEKVKSPQELQTELQRHEHSNPDKYLQVETEIQENVVKLREAGLFRKAEYGTDGFTINGIIKNTASIAVFKDALLNVQYFSHTGTLLHEEEQILYEFYKPNSVKNFTLQVYPPAETKKYSVTLKSITPAE